jgi:hypothetical protein
MVGSLFEVVDLRGRIGCHAVEVVRMYSRTGYCEALAVEVESAWELHAAVCYDLWVVGKA